MTEIQEYGAWGQKELGPSTRQRCWMTWSYGAWAQHLHGPDPPQTRVWLRTVKHTKNEQAIRTRSLEFVTIKRSMQIKYVCVCVDWKFQVFPVTVTSGRGKLNEELEKMLVELGPWRHHRSSRLGSCNPPKWKRQIPGTTTEISVYIHA